MSVLQKALIGFGVAIAATLFTFGLFASPAATQSWVKNYVSTNSVASATVSNSVGRASVVMAGGTATVMEILEAGGTNAVRVARDAAIADAMKVANVILDGGAL